MRLGPTATFNELAELYESDPVRFLEEILTGRYECVDSDECANCQLWDRVNGAEPRHITRKNHASDGQLPWPHRFQADTAFYLLPDMSQEQVLHLVRRLRRSPKRAEQADLLSLYYREKFQKGETTRKSEIKSG